MAAATIVEEVFTSDASREVVTLIASDGETYTSKKFNTIKGAVISLNVAEAGFTDEQVSVSYSGSVATIEILGTDTTDLAMTLVLFGNPGN